MIDGENHQMRNHLIESVEIECPRRLIVPCFVRAKNTGRPQTVCALENNVAHRIRRYAVRSDNALAGDFQIAEIHDRLPESLSEHGVNPVAETDNSRSLTAQTSVTIDFKSSVYELHIMLEIEIVLAIRSCGERSRLDEMTFFGL